MNRKLLFRSVFSRLWRFKAKSIFMGLGIMVGVLATVLLQSVAGSVRSRFLEFLGRAYPSDAIVLMGGSGPMGGPAGRNSVKLADVETVASALAVSDWDPSIVVGSRDVKRAGNSVRVNVAGMSEKAESVRRRSVAEGEFLSADDVRSRANVALLGATTARALFPGESPIGAEIFIDNAPFRVKGVLEPAGVDVHGGDDDAVIAVPYTTLMERMLRINFVSSATFVLADRNRVEGASKEVVRILRERHGIAQGQKDDFSVFTSVSMRELFDRSFRTFTIFVPLIAGTVFLISAVVILSILQISIKGRVAEIGLRKAVGARPRDLQAQIVLEIVMVSAAACLAGVILARLGIALAAPMLAARMGVHHVTTPISVVVVAVAAALSTGLLGGILPARRAAGLDPVEALR
ncbi:MAG: ABC transporter permease [Thermoanaerobaculia bacterium]